MPKPENTVSKRQHIVETAYELFTRAGYHATGIDRIIAAADIAKMTMYRNFPSKDDLIVAVLNHSSARFDAQLDQLMERAGTPAEKIGAVIDWYERWFRRPDFYGCAFAHALAEFGEAGHPVFNAVLDHKNGLKRRLTRILLEPMGTERAAAAAMALALLLEGATLMAQLGQGDDAIQQIRTALPAIIGSAEN